MLCSIFFNAKLQSGNQKQMQQQYQNQSSEKSTQKNFKLKGRQTKAKGLKFEISKKIIRVLLKVKN